MNLEFYIWNIAMPRPENQLFSLNTKFLDLGWSEIREIILAMRLSMLECLSMTQYGVVDTPGMSKNCFWDL